MRTSIAKLLLFLVGINSQCILSAPQSVSEDQCLLAELKKANSTTTVAEIKSRCRITLSDNNTVTMRSGKVIKKGAISERYLSERNTAFNPHVITPHKMNYILPILASDQINNNVFSKYEDWNNNLDDLEAKFQLSIKVPMNHDDLFIEGDGLFFAFTLQAWWQIFSNDISKPFRETNYQPEVFYLAPTDWHPFGGNTGFILGAEHQSNGRSQPLSRSWNRLYASLLFEKDRLAMWFRPWWRLPEEEKEAPLLSDGDDNPDIEDYMGHFEFGVSYRWKQYEFSFTGRENFKTNKGATELGLTFPLWGKIRGYAQYFNGYGESLIDYNYHQQRLGFGIALTDLY